MLRRALSMFVEHSNVGLVQPVIRPEDVEIYRRSAAGFDLLPPAFGGATRQASVRAGLEALAPRKPDIVLIHDAARPFASAALVARAIAATAKTGAAIPALPVTDTVKTVDAAGLVDKTLDRNSLRLVQTPQAFAFEPLLAAHRRAAAAGRADFTDDAALAEWAGLKVSVFDGEPGNIKITTEERFRARRSGRIRHARRSAHRQRHRRACLRPRRSRHPGRHPHRARARRSSAIPTPTWRCMR